MKEQKIDQGVQEFFCQRLRVLKVFILLLFLSLVLRLGFVEKYLWFELTLPRFPPTNAPEKLLLPRVKVVRLVDEGKDPGKYPNAVEKISFRSNIWVWERWMMPQCEDTGRECEYQSL